MKPSIEYTIVSNVLIYNLAPRGGGKRGGILKNKKKQTEFQNCAVQVLSCLINSY